MAVLLTNDDGINAPGLKALEYALQGLDDLYISAPAVNHSGVGSCISLGKKITIEQSGEKGCCQQRWAVGGTPSDAVKFGLQQLLDKKPRLIVSGINLGYNIGINIRCSGTVGAAFEGLIAGVRVLAVSVDFTDPSNFKGACHYARLVAQQALRERGKKPFLWNLNVPAADPGQIRGLKAVPHGMGGVRDILELHPDNDGTWRLGGEWLDIPKRSNTDLAPLLDGWAVITPLRYDMNDYAALERMRSFMPGIKKSGRKRR